MEGGIRSGGVLKKKTSSGCLIIKKKVENENPGVEGLSIHSKEKNRPRLVASDEDESLEYMKRIVNDNRLRKGSIGYKGSDIHQNRGYNMNNIGVSISGERKRSRPYLNQYDGYKDCDGKRMRNEFADDKFRTVGHRVSGNANDFCAGSSLRNLQLDKRKQLGEYVGLRNQGSDMEKDDESQMSVSLLRLNYKKTTDEPIRLQGKNGVLKVLVNKKKMMDLHSHHRNYDSRVVEERVSTKTDNFVKKDLSPPLPVFPSLKPPENMVDNEKVGVKLKKEVKHVLGKGLKSEISTMICGLKVKDRELKMDVTTDTTLNLAPPGPLSCISMKGTKKEKEKTTPSENVTPVKWKDANEGRGKRGGSTEKQMLREKIRGMLLESGWTIDYRPRRNRDYLDSVYINPNGTAYWSIIKAYDALKKQLDEDTAKTRLDIVGSPLFAPLSDDLLNKLTRQTKKKIEEEMKRKRKDDVMNKKAKISNIRDSEQSCSDSDQYMKQNNKLRKGKQNDDDLSYDSPHRKPMKLKVGKPYSASYSNAVQGRTSKVSGRCTLLVRDSDNAGNSVSDRPYSGKRTILAWLVDSGTTHLSEKVQYMNRKRTRVMLEGWITKEGIHCGCCSKILTVSKFELHAGSKLRQPFQNIFLESGVSLLQCQLDALNKQREFLNRDFHTVGVDGDDPDDDTCGICGDGGALICCDSCPSTFHQICLEIQMLPSGDWNCPNCICKFCGDATEGNDSAAADELTKCSFCEKKYHKSCGERVHALPMSSNGGSFCGPKCQELYDHLQKILGVKYELDSGFSWSLVQRVDFSDTLCRGFPQRVESNSKLAVALSVMDECFLPITDRRSGINMIHNVVYSCGSNFNRLNYSGFYTAILERCDEIVSAASLRIHGTSLAEMPFIGTRQIYRRQGMCRRLLSAIEAELCSLQVENLIIPAIAEHRHTWTTSFGFHPLEDGLKKEIKSINMLVFPWTDMLQKQLVNQEISGGVKISEPIKCRHMSPVLDERPDIDSFIEHNQQTTHNYKAFHVNKINDKLTDSLLPSSDTSSASASDSISESDTLIASKGTTIEKSDVEKEQKEPSLFSTSRDGEESGSQCYHPK